MPDNRRTQDPEELENPDVEHEITDEDLDEVDGGDGGQGTYPPYL
ncbi:hypothetical protein [Streptomyces sp. NPDC001833]